MYSMSVHVTECTLPDILLIKQQFVVTHTMHKTPIPTLLRQMGYKHTFCQNMSTKKNCLILYYHET
jgi:hypothetical protein